MVNLQVLCGTTDLALPSRRVDNAVSLLLCERPPAAFTAPETRIFLKDIRRNGASIRVLDFNGPNRETKLTRVSNSARRVFVSSAVYLLGCYHPLFGDGIQNKTCALVCYGSDMRGKFS